MSKLSGFGQFHSPRAICLQLLKAADCLLPFRSGFSCTIQNETLIVLAVPHPISCPVATQIPNGLASGRVLWPFYARAEAVSCPRAHTGREAKKPSEGSPLAKMLGKGNEPWHQLQLGFLPRGAEKYTQWQGI